MLGHEPKLGTRGRSVTRRARANSNPATTKSLKQRREQMVGDAVQLTLDWTHWNRVNPAEEPIELPLDFQPDVEWELNAPDEDDDKKAG